MRYRATLTLLSIGQIISWAALYYGFTSFVLPMQHELGWSRPTLMGAFTLGLAVWGAATYAVGAELRERAFWLLALTFTLYSFCVAALWAHAVPALAAKGLSEAQALAVLVWFGPAQVTGRFVFAAAGRGVSLRALGLVVLCGLPLSFALFAFAREVAWLVVFALLFGAANGLVTIVRGGMVPEFFGRAHVGRIGGAMSAIGLLARAAAPLATAWMLAVLNDYEPLMLWLAGLGALAVIAFALAAPPRRRSGG